MSQGKYCKTLLLIFVITGRVISWYSSVTAGELEISNIQFVSSKLGERLVNYTYHPTEIIFLKFDIGNMLSGVQFDDKGKFNISIELEVIDENENTILNREPILVLNEQNSFKTDKLLVTAQITLPFDSKPGRYTVKFYFKDILANKSVGKDVYFNFGEKRLGIVNLKLTTDPDGNYDCPNKFARGNILYIHYKVVGFTKKEDKVWLKQDMAILTEDEKIINRFEILNFNEEIPSELENIPIKNSLPLNRAGKYKILIRLTDVLAKTKVERIIAIEVFE